MKISNLIIYHFCHANLRFDFEYGFDYLIVIVIVFGENLHLPSVGLIHYFDLFQFIFRVKFCLIIGFFFTDRLNVVKLILIMMILIECCFLKHPHHLDLIIEKAFLVVLYFII